MTTLIIDYRYNMIELRQDNKLIGLFNFSKIEEIKYNKYFKYYAVYIAINYKCINLFVDRYEII